MKKLLLAGATCLAFAGMAFAQGWFYLNNADSNGSLSVDAVNNWYAGTFGVEVWMMNGVNTAAINAINAVPVAPGSGITAYNMMVADGFMKEATLTDETTVAGAPGLIVIPYVVKMPDVSPPTSKVTVALAVWNNTAVSWAAMMDSWTAGTRAGVTAFSQVTTLGAAPPDITTWNQDLVMTTVPEPGTFALAGMGVAALLVFRRRKLPV